MLKQLHKLHRAALALALTAALGLSTTTAAFADVKVDGGGDTGSIGITNPGNNSGGGGNDVDGVADVNFTPGPTTCTLNKSEAQKQDKTIPCSDGDGTWWDNTGQFA
ncbi:hypothetical protein [Gulosibacter bifidus]|uniref:Secreted protein n=1 Tax=Gulosibacter bifidus TaxID=272239 RepID=A0ABW5RI76_9MICO|nr:hypothetical protein [Gulosibacter bifidus]